MLMLSPFWAHRNPEYFEDPTTFNPVSFSYILGLVHNIEDVGPANGDPRMTLTKVNLILRRYLLLSVR